MYSLLFIILLITFCYYENNVLSVEKINLKSDKISEDIKIIHLSDLHDKQFGKENKRLLKKISQEKPDLIVTTGDMIDSDLIDYKKTLKFLNILSEKYPVFYIPGNNEMRTKRVYEILEKVQETGTITLKNEIKTIYIKDTKINILGLAEEKIERTSDESNENIKVYKNILSNFEKLDGVKLVLDHYPENFEGDKKYNYSEYDFDIMFAGHAHGGQFILPFLGGLYAPNQGIFPKYYKGVHGDKNKLIISRGFGSRRAPFRLFNRPQIISVKLTKIN